MEPQIQYATASDGVSIAFYTEGEGHPLVRMPNIPWSHIKNERSSAIYGDLFDALGRTQIVCYDNRGSGLSQRSVPDLSFEAHLRDLETIVDHLRLDTFALSGSLHSTPIAIAYAVRHPERVSRLVLNGGYARASDHMASERYQSLMAMMETDWEFFTETAARFVFGWEDEANAKPFVTHMRESTSQDVAIAAYREIRAFDVTDLLAKVQAPTLVVQTQQISAISLDTVRPLAAGIPNARLAITENMAAMAAAGKEFLEAGRPAASPAESPTPGGFATILFTDMESSTALRRKLGDAKVQELVRAHNGIVRTALGEHDGREIKHTGDGIMASFSTATSALQCSIAIQQGVAAHVDEHPETPLGVYVGLNAGEPIAEEQDLFGTSVDLARRICDHAEPGQILASNVVRELAEGKDFLFGDIGDVVPKGFEEPVRLYEVRWRDEG